ncbi:MAG: hypothetical protein O2960_11045 [Verrucomicrobia bacterium]|nr:hypothetical protein [Verrucomicrobiota bacterium]
MRKCLFCPNTADSHEHVLPQWLHRCISSETDGKFPVQVGRYVDGQGYLDERKFVSLNFKARIVCVGCNNGWMSKMESEVEQILKALTGKQFPVLAHTHLEQLREHAQSLAQWMSKTALTTSYALPGKLRLAGRLAEKIGQGRPPHGVWMDVAKAKNSGIAAALTKMFPTINGNRYVGVQTHQTGECFQFCIQINQLLLRVGMSPGAEVGYVAHGGLNPFRLFPEADSQVPENIEFKDVNHFLHSIVLRTWAGCAGEVPSPHG